MEIHGHRGARGVYPENTIEGFEYAIGLGVRAIELDLVVSADKELIVSHDPWMDATICKHPDGSEISCEEEKNLNLFKLSAKEIQAYKCGRRLDHEFPDQKEVLSYKPTFSELVKKTKSTNIFYNIEIKSEEDWYDHYCPSPIEYATLISQAITIHGLEKQCMIQSFDSMFLNAFHALRPDVRIGYLVENQLNIEGQLKELNFRPDYFNPNFQLLDESVVTSLHQKRILVLAWTVNEDKDIRHVIGLNVDGIISDYPQNVQEILNSIG